MSESDTPSQNMVTPNQRLQNGNQIFVAKVEALMGERSREIRKASGELVGEIKKLQVELTAARAEIARWNSSFDGHVYVKNEEYAELCENKRQRDRLAEALLALRNNESLSIGGAAYGIVEQALQSLTTNAPTSEKI